MCAKRHAVAFGFAGQGLAHALIMTASRWANASHSASSYSLRALRKNARLRAAREVFSVKSTKIFRRRAARSYSLAPYAGRGLG
jgi:hypothetical protein